jgi:RNA polymerase sigma factor (sigma-70 family)
MFIFPHSEYDTLPHDQLLLIAKSSAPVAEKAKISLLRAHEPLLKSNLRGIPSTLIEDAFQVATFGFLKAIDKYDLNSGVTIGAYAAFWVRKEVRKLMAQERQYSTHCSSLEEREESGVEVVDHNDPRFEQSRIAEESVERCYLVNGFISTLSGIDRSVVVLYYFRGLTQASIAKLYGVSAVAINKRIQRILREGRNYFAN